MRVRWAWLGLVCVVGCGGGSSDGGDASADRDAERDAYQYPPDCGCDEDDGGWAGAGGEWMPDARVPDAAPPVPDAMPVDAAPQPDAYPPFEPCAAAPYAVPGPYAAGVTTLHLADGTPVEVWYPASPDAVAGLPRDSYDLREWLPADAQALIPDEDAPYFETDAWRDVPPSDAGPFPLVLFSHGLAGYRSQSTFLTTHLASWGFVVAAPDHVDRNLGAILSGSFPGADVGVQLLRDTRTLMETENQGDGPLAGRIDPTRFAITGHSMGGGAAGLFSAEPGVAGWVGLASGATALGEATPQGPVLLMDGTTDAIVPSARVHASYDEYPDIPRIYVSLAGAGHLAFSDLCAIGRAQGGVLQIALDHGVDVPVLIQRLGTDGCRPTDVRAESTWPVINHFTTALLRRALDIDPEAAVSVEAVACFGGSIDAAAFKLTED